MKNQALLSRRESNEHQWDRRQKPMLKSELNAVSSFTLPQYSPPCYAVSGVRCATVYWLNCFSCQLCSEELFMGIFLVIFNSVSPFGVQTAQSLSGHLCIFYTLYSNALVDRWIGISDPDDPLPPPHPI